MTGSFAKLPEETTKKESTVDLDKEIEIYQISKINADLSQIKSRLLTIEKILGTIRRILEEK